MIFVVDVCVGNVVVNVIDIFSLIVITHIVNVVVGNMVSDIGLMLLIVNITVAPPVVISFVSGVVNVVVVVVVVVNVVVVIGVGVAVIIDIVIDVIILAGLAGTPVISSVFIEELLHSTYVGLIMPSKTSTATISIDKSISENS